MVRGKNVTTTAFKNLIDWIAAGIVFSLIGFGLMFGLSYGGIIGTNLFLFEGINNHKLGYIFYFFQLAFAGTSLTIVSGALAERCGFIPYLCCALLMGLVIYPVFGHWSWGNMFYPNNGAWLADLGFIDFSGSTVIHGIGAWVALVGVMMLGPRIGRYDKNGNVNTADFEGNNIAFSVFGVFILWFGWIGFNGGSVLEMNNTVGLIIVNTNICAIFSAFAGFIHCFFFQKREDLYEKLIGSALGGLVAVTACCHCIDPFRAIIIGLCAGIIHNIAYDLVIKKWRFDDVVGAIPVHGFCGIFGTLCVGLFGDLSAFNGASRIEQIGVQLLGVVVCFLWTTCTSLALFSILKATSGLRVSPKLELEGVSITKEFESAPAEKIDLSDDELLAMLQ
jgi:ammonium transporter, Amt family